MDSNVVLFILELVINSNYKKGASEWNFGHAFLLLQHDNIFDLEN